MSLLFCGLSPVPLKREVLMVLLRWLTSAVGGAQENNRCSAKTWLTGKGDLSIQGMKLARHWQARGIYSIGHKSEAGDSQGSEEVWYPPDKSWKSTVI